MTYTKNDVVGQIVANNYKAASIFSSYGIDFCCRGNRTIDEVAEKNKLSSDELIKKLNEIADKIAEDQPDFQNWELDLLADYIEKKHHRYVRRRTSEILPYLNKVVKVHGNAHPELKEIANEFDASVLELNAHMQKEEHNLFPHIRSMITAMERNETLEAPMFGSVLNPIQAMMAEHDQEGVRFRRIRNLSNDYTPPVDACQTYRVTYAMMEEFEQDLHRHIHLENNILFPKSAKLEEQFNYVQTTH